VVGSIVGAPIASRPTPDPQVAFSALAAAPAPYVEPVTMVADLAPLEEMVRKARRTSNKMAVIKRLPPEI
jgi:hypothetical protein